MMKVWNKRDRSTPKNAVYIGRPSKWGNPFVIGSDGTRGEVIEKYQVYARSKFSQEDLLSLVGRDLVCWCAPLPCHGDALIALVQELEL